MKLEKQNTWKVLKNILESHRQIQKLFKEMEKLSEKKTANIKKKPFLINSNIIWLLRKQLTVNFRQLT